MGGKSAKKPSKTPFLLLKCHALCTANVHGICLTGCVAYGIMTATRVTRCIDLFPAHMYTADATQMTDDCLIDNWLKTWFQVWGVNISWISMTFSKNYENFMKMTKIVDPELWNSRVRKPCQRTRRVLYRPLYKSQTCFNAGQTGGPIFFRKRTFCMCGPVAGTWPVIIFGPKRPRETRQKTRMVAPAFPKKAPFGPLFTPQITWNPGPLPSFWRF